MLAEILPVDKSVKYAEIMNMPRKVRDEDNSCIKVAFFHIQRATTCFHKTEIPYEIQIS